MVMHYAPPTAADRRNATADTREERRARRAEERAAASAAALEQAARDGWPELEGTPAQVAWAATIRQSTINHASARATADPSPEGIAALDALLSVSDASWWIDHRRISMPVGTSFVALDLYDLAVMAQRRITQ